YLPQALRSPAALPTETPTEERARHRRHMELRNRLSAGRVVAVNDLVTLNLDLEAFAQDVIATAEHDKLLPALQQAVASVRVLDPTCGSGAFLVAALRVLAGLASASQQRHVVAQNLSGVDVQPEAVELCRLRLLLERAVTENDLGDLSAVVANICA